VGAVILRALALRARQPRRPDGGLSIGITRKTNMSYTNHANQRPAGAADTSGAGAERYDPYLAIHKALRALHAQMLLRLGQMDPEDDQDTRAVISQLRQLVSVGEGHLRAENAFLHPALEIRAPGSTHRTAGDHLSHGEAFARLLAGCDEVERSSGAARAAAASALYRRFALFMAEDLVHMNAEETENNAVLWATHTDGEIQGIVARIIASVPPEKHAFLVRWMLTANTPRDRLKLLDGVKSGTPPEHLPQVLERLLAHLPGAERGKLVAALG
jgi:hypothetical protein